MRLLAQRENSRVELSRKLAARTEDQDEIPALLDHLEQVVSDRRFDESFVRTPPGAVWRGFCSDIIHTLLKHSGD